MSSTNGNGLSDPYAYQQSYAYDGLDRLTSSADSKPNSGGTAWVGTNGQTWGGLDALGNWRTSGTDTNGDGTTDQTQTRTHNAANEITGVSGSGATWGTPTYDAAGNLTRLPPATGSSDAYQLATYDAWNHQVGVVGYNSSNVATHTTTNRFDGLGRRISGNTGEVYFNEGWQEIETQNSSGTPTEQTVYSLRYVDAPLSRDVIGTSGTDRQWVQQDANYNVTSVADTAGAVLERYRYSAYGERTVMNAAGSMTVSGNASLLGSMYGHQGGRIDPATGEYLFNYGGNGRFYDPAIGAWIQRDRAVYRDGENLFQYVASSPENWNDPKGQNKSNELVKQLLDVESRKNFDWNVNGGQEGPNGRWLYFLAKSLRMQIRSEPSSFAIYSRDIRPDGLTSVDKSVGDTCGGHQFISVVDKKEWRPGMIIGYAVTNTKAVAGDLPTPEIFQAGDVSTLVKGPYRRNGFTIKSLGKDAVHSTDDELSAVIQGTPMQHDYSTVFYNCQNWASDAYSAIGGSFIDPTPTGLM